MSNLNIKEDVLLWLKLNTELKEKRREIKEFNEKKKQIEEIILDQMKTFKIDTVTLSSGGAIKKNISKRSKSLSKDNINSFIYETLKDDSLAEKLIEKLK